MQQDGFDLLGSDLENISPIAPYRRWKTETAKIYDCLIIHCW